MALPLFLDGAAFSVYLHLDEKDCYEKVKQALIKAFSTNPFTAYEQFVQRRWSNESVDVYLSDLRRLARLAGIEENILLRRAFVVGLPSYVSR